MGTNSTGQWKLYLLGAPRLEHNGQPLVITLRKALALLIYLAVTRQAHSRDALATLFWPEKDQQSARANLRRILYDLNQLLDGQLLTMGTETVSRQDNAPLWIDADAFQQAVGAYLSPVPESVADDHAVLAAGASVVELYTGDFLAGFTLPDCPAFDDWQFFQRAELRSAYAQLLQGLIAAYAAQEKFTEALHYARRWLLHDPLEEVIHRELMRLHAQAGEVTAALRQYDECVRILQEELDVPPDEETTALYEAIRARRFPKADRVTRWQGDKVTSDKVTSDKVTSDKVSESPLHPVTPSPSHSVTPPPHNLPAQTTPFIGRVQELEDVLRRLNDPACRLLTLIGPGGIGKTRLALEAAHKILDFRFWILDSVGEDNPKSRPEGSRQNPKFPDGVFFVSLQSVTTPSGLIEAIAEATGFRFYSAVPPQQQLMNYLREKQMLLVLDNFEHLLASVALVADLLLAAPQIKLLVTSRVALNLHEEWFHPLAGMALPPANGKGHRVTTGQEVNGKERVTDAVQLFVQSAQRARPNFILASEQEQVARICRLVDGAPLALELAAAWVKVLSCQQIAEEIAHNLDILTTRYQNIPSRHRSMRAVLEQTWQLLTPDEQQTLLHLPVFEGGFGQEAAREVAGASLLMLATLTEKALVRVTQDAAGQNRYQMHELLRQFVMEKLAALPEENAAIRAHHSRYYLHFLQHRAPQLTGKEQQIALQAIGVEIDNVRAAWQWAVEQRAVASLQAAVDPIYDFYQIRSRYLEGKDLFAQAAQQLQAIKDDDAATLLHLRLRARCGAFCHFLCEYEVADAYLQGCLALASQLDQPAELAFILNFLGQLAMWRGEKALAKQHLTESLAISRSMGDKAGMASALEKLANLVDATLGEYAESKELATQTLHLSRDLGRPDWIAYALDTLGFVTFALGEYADSEAYYRESLQLFETIGDQYGIAMALGGLGLVYWAIGGRSWRQPMTISSGACSSVAPSGTRGRSQGGWPGWRALPTTRGAIQRRKRWCRKGSPSRAN
ncbi:MAG: BTAD domain-containing putative transcriptional regulator [Caldilineaceae bacterium]